MADSQPNLGMVTERNSGSAGFVPWQARWAAFSALCRNVRSANHYPIWVSNLGKPNILEAAVLDTHGAISKGRGEAGGAHGTRVG
jgi:hypothetical protein